MQGSSGIRLGRLFGISLWLDYSWIFIFLLMTWNLTAIFSQSHPQWGAANLIVAVIAAVLFFGSVLAHELGHALVAKAYGLRVREIRLFLFGGVSDIEREPPSPKAELLIAIVGPIVSFLIGLASVALALLVVSATEGWQALTIAGSPGDASELLGRLGPISTILLWLGPINVMIGLFNLIPGFPLDGGRVLRAIMWRITGDLMRATRIASVVGQLIGWTFVLMGVAMFFGAKIPFFGRGAGSGIWLAFIGWFLSSAAVRSYRGLIVQEVLDGVKVAHLMRRTGPVMPQNTSVSAAVSDWFMRSSEHAFPVVSFGDHFAGIVAAGDIRRAPREAWGTTPVSEIMTPRDALITAHPSDDALTALRKLGERDVEQLPVLDEQTGELVGMLERTAIARWLEMNVMSSRTKSHVPREAT